MITNIRSNVFETNSSSTHSVSLNFSDNPDEFLLPFPPNDDGKIILSGGNFTDMDLELISPQDKSNFVATYIIVYDDTELKDRFDRILLDHSGAKEIVYDIRLVASDGKQPNTFFSPKIAGAYEYHYDEDKDEDCEICFKDLLEEDELLKRFLFTKSSSITAEINFG